MFEDSDTPSEDYGDYKKEFVFTEVFKHNAPGRKTRLRFVTTNKDEYMNIVLDNVNDCHWSFDTFSPKEMIQIRDALIEAYPLEKK